MPATAELYSSTVTAVPDLDALLMPASAEGLDGALLVDEEWLGRRMDDTAARWNSDDPRVEATLWWYSASSVLLAPAIAGLVVCGRSPDIHPERLRLTLAPNGYLAATRSHGSLPGGTDAVGARLGAAIRSIIQPLAAISGATERALWAIAADSIASRCLWAGAATGDVERATALGGAVAAAMDPRMPRPRYVDVPGPDGTSQRFVRRGSCCLLYEAPGKATCSTCPRRHPSERAALLAEQVR